MATELEFLGRDGTEQLVATVKNLLNDKLDKEGLPSFTDSTLSLTEDNILKVNTTDTIEDGNNLPVTSAAVYAMLGDVETLLASI